MNFYNKLRIVSFFDYIKLTIACNYLKNNNFGNKKIL